MVHINITGPEDVVKELAHIKNKSRFITETLREKFAKERKKEMDRKLQEAYKQSAQEDKTLAKEWDGVLADGVE